MLRIARGGVFRSWVFSNVQTLDCKVQSQLNPQVKFESSQIHLGTGTICLGCFGLPFFIRVVSIQIQAFFPASRHVFEQSDSTRLSPLVARMDNRSRGSSNSHVAQNSGSSWCKRSSHWVLGNARQHLGRSATVIHKF